jgi:type III pantothenate kinase
VGIDYPKPDSIGPDRLANAVAARAHFGAPVVVVDFGTAVTFDVVMHAAITSAASSRPAWRR